MTSQRDSALPIQERFSKSRISLLGFDSTVPFAQERRYVLRLSIESVFAERTMTSTVWPASVPRMHRAPLHDPDGIVEAAALDAR